MKLETLKVLQETLVQKGLAKFGAIITGADSGRLKYDDMGVMVYSDEKSFTTDIIKMFNRDFQKTYIDIESVYDDEDYETFCEYYWIVDRF